MRAMQLAGALAVAFSGTAFGKDALCYTTHDGEYPCAFTGLDDKGSFQIAAEGKPTFQLWIEAPGVASVGATYEAGGRSIPLPGTYQRSEDDRACWENAETETGICAW